MNIKVDTTLKLDRACIHYQVGMQPEEALDFVNRAEAYNGFTQGDLRTLVQKINEIVPPMQYGPGNPNNGHPWHTFKIGNEYSRVIYLEMPRCRLENMNAAEIGTLVERLKALGKKANADEVDAEATDHQITIRYWWD